MTTEEWIIEADKRIKGCRETIEIMHQTSSRESFWHSVRAEANYAKETIKFLEAGKNLLEEKNKI